MADYQPDSRPGTLEPSAQGKSTAAIPERTEEDEQRLFRLFRGWTLSERDGHTRQWVYQFGYDIQNTATKERRWVCCMCIKRKDPRPKNYSYKGLQNAESHLFKDHNGIVDPSEIPRDQEITNLLIKRFNKAAFQQMIVNWIVNTNRSFTTAKDADLRAIFEYLNPSVSNTEAHISDVTVRAIAEREFNANKSAVRETLRKSPGQIHIQFDGWRSGNRHALYGVTCIFRDLDNRPRKCVLGLPELLGRHTGENIAEQILDIVREFEIGDKLGYFTLDNASNNKTTMEELGHELGFDWKKRWVRCIGHVVNIVVKHMLFGQDPNAFEQQIYDGQLTAAREHEQWSKRGPVGKWHNFAVLAMIDRALVLQPFYDPFIQRALSEWNKANLTKSGSVRKGARMPFFLKEENRISSRDWCVLQALRDILLDFQLAVKALEGDGQGKHQKQGQEDEIELPLSGKS
ncbi:putative AC9 transposase [Fusarium oxysporum f. sp. conglutinans]|nr:putative AC9 transposase [Fusarium oxysporum f. sp. conglutinans]